MLVPIEKVIPAYVFEEAGSLQRIDELTLGAGEIDVDADAAQIGDGVT